MATADLKGGRKPTEGTLNHFEKLLEGPCPNHALSGGSNKGEQEKDPAPTVDDAEEKDDDFLTPNGCLMIFRGSPAYDSKHR